MLRRLAIPAGLATLLILLALFALAAQAHGPEHLEGPLHPGGAHRLMIEMLGNKGGYLGVSLTEITPELREHFGAPQDAGVLVAKVVDDSPAARAGVEVGDILTRVDNADVSSLGAVKRLVQEREDGETVQLEVWRDGRMETLDAAIEVRAGSREPFEGHALARQALRRALALRCDDGEDCDSDFGRFRFDFHHGPGFRFGCGDAENCQLMISCENGECECTENGEPVDCDDLRGRPDIRN